MKKLFTLFFIAVLAFSFSSCGKGKNVEEVKKVTETSKDTVKKEQKPSCEIKKYDTPVNKTVYVNVLPEDKAEIPVSKLIDWVEKDVKEYLNFNYNGDNKEGTASEEFYLEYTKDNKINAEYVMDKNKIKMENVKIEGNKFYSVLTLNNVSEEFNGKFVKFKALVKGDSDYISGLLINRKGVWKFFFMYV